MCVFFFNVILNNMSTREIRVSIDVNATVANTRTYALACKTEIDLADYANQVIVQKFFQQYKDNASYRLALVELKDPAGELHSGDGSRSMSGTIIQVFESFGSGTITSDFSTYTVYVITFQSPDARNPTIKVVSRST